MWHRPDRLAVQAKIAAAEQLGPDGDDVAVTNLALAWMADYCANLLVWSNEQARLVKPAWEHQGTNG